MPDVSDSERRELERRVNAGEWLRPGEVAKLLGVSGRPLGRTTIHRYLEAGDIGYRYRGGGTQRECDPADVRKLLARAREVHRGESGASPEA
jgi:hypothetical protein